MDIGIIVNSIRKGFLCYVRKKKKKKKKKKTGRYNLILTKVLFCQTRNSTLILNSKKISEIRKIIKGCLRILIFQISS